MYRLSKRGFSLVQVVTLVVASLLLWSAGSRFLPGLTGGSALASPLSVSPTAPLAPSDNGFTYQGKLLNGGNPANGSYDFRFTLFDAATGGNQIDTPVSVAGKTVSNGLFTANLAFSSANAFNGDGRWLQIEVKPAGGASYTTLNPRQPITPVPYALYAFKTKGYANVVTVAKSGGDFTTISAALASITGANAANAYLIKVAPGVYNEHVVMKQWVDIEGSGQNNTVITYGGYPYGVFDSGTVKANSNAELRNLTVTNTGGDEVAAAVYSHGTGGMLTDVALNASGGSVLTVGIYVDTADRGLLINNVRVEVNKGSAQNGAGIFITYAQGTTTIRNSTILANGTGANGVRADSAYVTMDASQVNSAGTTVGASNGLLKVGASRLSGGHAYNSGGNSLVCAGVYDDAYTFFANTCP